MLFPEISSYHPKLFLSFFFFLSRWTYFQRKRSAAPDSWKPLPVDGSVLQNSPSSSGGLSAQWLSVLQLQPFLFSWRKGGAHSSCRTLMGMVVPKNCRETPHAMPARELCGVSCHLASSHIQKDAHAASPFSLTLSITPWADKGPQAVLI